MAQYKNKKKRRRKLAKKRKLSERQTKPKAGDIENHVEWYDPDKHKHLIFMSVARVSSGQQLKNLFKQVYRIQTFVAQEKLKLIKNRTHWIVKSAFYSKSKRERAEIAETEAIFGSPLSYDPRRPFYKLHYEKLEELKIMMGRYPNAAFLFESLDRAVRADAYLKENKDAPLTEGEVLEFALVVHPYPVILMCPPWATANKMGAYYKLFKGFEDSEHFRDYKLFLNYCKQHKLFGMKPVDRLGIKADFYDKVIRRFEFYRKFRKEDLSLEKMYDLIFEKYPEVPKSTIKLWCQEYVKKQNR